VGDGMYSISSSEPVTEALRFGSGSKGNVRWQKELGGKLQDGV
jgi:hypothetical protein